MEERSRLTGNFTLGDGGDLGERTLREVNVVLGQAGGASVGDRDSDRLAVVLVRDLHLLAAKRGLAAEVAVTLRLCVGRQNTRIYALQRRTYA